VLEVGYVTQHDFPYLAIEALVGGAAEPRGYLLHAQRAPSPAATPPAGSVVLASADSFVADAERATALAADGVHLVDMEGYSFAAVCAEFGVPMRCVKAVSDGADAQAVSSWLDRLTACAGALADWLSCHVPTG
jgi:adenosylhomocysteine nucleosidase